jgi:hypothetical protein
LSASEKAKFNGRVKARMHGRSENSGCGLLD